MYKLVLYDSNSLKVLKREENITNIEISDDEISWNGGKIRGLNSEFAVFTNDFIIPEILTSDILANDLKTNFNKVTLEEENKMLKERLTFAEDAILFLMDRG